MFFFRKRETWEHPSGVFFPSNPSEIRPIWFFRKMFIYASQKLWLHCVTWTTKIPTTITKCIPNIPSWPTLNLSKSRILAFEPTGPIFVRQIFVRILRACRMKVGLVGWGWRVFFFSVCPLKGGQIWCCQKDDEVFSVPNVPCPFWRVQRYIISVGCPGLVWNKSFWQGSDRCMEPKKLGYGILFLLEKMDLEPSYVSFFFFGVFFLVRSLFCRGNIMSVDISWLKTYAQNPAHKTGDAAVLCAFGASVSRHQSGLGGGWICSELSGGMVGGTSDMISMAGDNPRIPL